MGKVHGLFIGINDYPGSDIDLGGCVNDANDWRSSCSQAASTVMLIDSEATRATILSQTKAVLSRLSVGDWAIITFSGHGSWIPDRDGDEPDGRDEVLVPHDYWNPIVDDEIHQLLQDRPAGSRVLFVTDACSSGTVYRMFNPVACRAKVRFMDPHRMLNQDDREVHTHAERIAGRIVVPKATISPGVVHLAGCQDTEYCYDAVFDDRPNGAFSRVALDALKAMKRNITFQSWYNRIRKSLPSYDYPQRPKLNARSSEKKLYLPMFTE